MPFSDDGWHKMKPIAIIQARTGSTRLPGKVLMELGGHTDTVLSYVVRRCQLSHKLKGVLLATTDEAADDPIEELGKALGVDVFRGSHRDVLDRYVRAASHVGTDTVVRITSDCPLIDPGIIDRVIDEYINTRADYVCIAGYPRGTGDVELVTLAALQRAMKETTPADTYFREHVITYLLDHPDRFRLHIGQAPEAVRKTAYRLCVDEPDDLEVVRRVCAHFAPRIDFGLPEILALLEQHPEIPAINRQVRQKTT